MVVRVVRMSLSLILLQLLVLASAQQLSAKSTLISARYVCNRLDGMCAAGPLACLSLPSIMSWIRPNTPVWKLALFQSCSPKNKDGRERYIIFIFLSYMSMHYPPASEASRGVYPCFIWILNNSDQKNFRIGPFWAVWHQPVFTNGPYCHKNDPHLN